MAAKKKTTKKKGSNAAGDEFHEDPPRATDTNGAGNNSDARMAALNDAIEEWCALQEKEDELIELYISDVRDQKNKVKSRLKADFEIPTKAFNARATLRMIERKAEDEVVLATNELFKAVPVGEGVDLVVLADRVAAKKAEKEAAAAEKAAAKAKVQATPEAQL